MEANLATFLFEGKLNLKNIYLADLDKYLRMTDTIEAIFEAMPMAILVFLNNEAKLDKGLDGWPPFDLATFFSSVGTITFYCISLIKYLFQEDADILWE